MIWQFQEMKKIVDQINYEIEYVLRPKTAPPRLAVCNHIFHYQYFSRRLTAPNLRTGRRAGSRSHSQQHGVSRQRDSSINGQGYPNIHGKRSSSTHQHASNTNETRFAIQAYSSKTYIPHISRGRSAIRNIHVPDSLFPQGEHSTHIRPKTAPTHR